MTKRSQPDCVAQLTFSPLRFKHTRALVTIGDAAEVLNVTANHVRDLVDIGELAAAPINNSAERSHVRILRYSVEAWFLEQWLGLHGTEYPVANSEEVTYWRQELRRKRAAAKAQEEARSL